ncbi:MAG TPA: hypothetical protein VFG20_03555 [Planctomycetaceae bacterium]|nr:hypothetical protein [Planctomycetaceae bacterium]
MTPQARFKVVQISFVGLLTAAAIVWWWLRPPAATAGPKVIAAIDQIGQIRGAIASTLQAVRQLTTIDGQTSTEVVVQRREIVNGMIVACDRLGRSVKSSDSEWLPVADSVMLLSKAQELAEWTLTKTPTVQVTGAEAAGIESLETNPDRTGMTAETIAVVESRAVALQNDTDNLFVTVRQSALRAAFSRGMWLGLEARDYLLMCVLLSSLLGLVITWQAEAHWFTPPAQALEAELRLLASGEPRLAVDRCFARSGELLKLADTFLIQSELRKGGGDVASSAVAE